MKKCIITIGLAYLSFCPLFKTHAAARHIVTELAPCAAVCFETVLKNISEGTSFPRSFDSFGIGTVLEEAEKATVSDSQEPLPLTYPDQGAFVDPTDFDPANDEKDELPSTEPQQTSAEDFQKKEAASPTARDYFASEESDSSDLPTDTTRPDIFLKALKNGFSYCASFFEYYSSTTPTILQSPQAPAELLVAENVSPQTALSTRVAPRELMTYSLSAILPAAGALTFAALARKAPFLRQWQRFALRLPQQPPIPRPLPLTPPSKLPTNGSVPVGQKPPLLALEGPKPEIKPSETKQQEQPFTKLKRAAEKTELPVQKEAPEIPHIPEKELHAPKEEPVPLKQSTELSELIVPKELEVVSIPKQTRYFTQATFKKAASNGNKMRRFFEEEIKFRKDTEKLHAKDAKNKAQEITRLERQAKNEVAKLDTQLKLKAQEDIARIKHDKIREQEKTKADTIRLKEIEQEQSKLREQEKAEAKKVQENTARLERERIEIENAKVREEQAKEDARLKKQAEDEVARVDAELKAKEIELKKFEAEQKKVQEKAELKAKNNAHLKAEVPAKEKVLKSKNKVAVTPHKKINFRPLATLSPVSKHTAKKLVTPPVASALIVPTLHHQLPDPTPLVPAHAAPPQEEQKNEEAKKDNTLKSQQNDDTDDTSGEKKKRKESDEEDNDDDDDTDPLTKTVRREKPAQEKEEPAEEASTAPPTAALPQEAGKSLAPTVRKAAALTIANGWASTIKVSPTPPAPLCVPTTEELNKEAARKRTVELPFGNNNPAVVATTSPPPLTAETPQPAVHQTAHPESGFSTTRTQKIEAPPAPTTLHEDAVSHYPDTFPNLAAKKESTATRILDFGKEIINATVVQPLKQLAHYVVETVSNWVT